MFKWILVFTATYAIGYFGWAYIIGSLMNMRKKAKMLIPYIISTVIMAAGVFVAIKVFDSKIPMLLGYVLSFNVVLLSDKVKKFDEE